MFRKIKFWVRYAPAHIFGPRAGVVTKIYRTKRDAMAAKKRGEVLVQMTGFYPSPLGKSGESK